MRRRYIIRILAGWAFWLVLVAIYYGVHGKAHLAPRPVRQLAHVEDGGSRRDLARRWNRDTAFRLADGTAAGTVGDRRVLQRRHWACVVRRAGG